MRATFASDVLPTERTGTHVIETAPISTTTIEVKNAMRGTQVELRSLPIHDQVEASGLGNLNSVIILLSALKALLAGV